MKKPLFIVLLFSIFFINNLKGQKDNNKGLIIDCWPEVARFPGLDDSLSNFLAINLNYPKTASRDSIEGKVIISFIIDTLGDVTQVKVKKGVREDLDNEAMRVVCLMPKWRPGKESGKHVETLFALPIKFSLPK